MPSDAKLMSVRANAKASAGKLAKQAQAKMSKLEQEKENFIERPYEQGEIYYKLNSQFIGSKALVRIEDLTKRFGDRTLFEGANFTINANEKIALKGKNGSGKTTLIKMILGEDKNYFGSIYI